MIGEAQPFGKGFIGLTRYLRTGHAREERDRVAWVETRNLPTEDPETAARLMAAWARESVRTQRPVYHLVISADPGDPADRRSLSRVADAVLRELGLSEHQVLIIAHNDTAHPHMHLVVNRVHPETHRAWENSFDWPKIEKALRAEEVALGWRVVPGKHAPMPGQEPAPALERGDAAFLRMVQERGRPVLGRASTWAELEEGLEAVGLHLRIKGGGFTIHDGRQEVKASDVARLFSRGNMEERLGKLSDYRRTRPAVPAARPAREPTPEPEQVAKTEPTVARVQPPEPAQPEPGPPIPTPEPPVRRPPLRERAKQQQQQQQPSAPQPEPEPVPEYLRPLVEAIRRGGAVEAEAERLDGIIAAANRAQAKADDLANRAKRADSAVEELRAAVRPVYADPSEAVGRMQEFRKTHTNYELHTALRQAPEQFGQLKAETVYPWWGLWVVPRSDYSEARDRAPGIAAPLDTAITAFPQQPKRSELEAAKAEADKLRGPGQKARTAREKLPQSYTYEAEVKALMRPLASALGAYELDRELWPLLESNRHAHSLARRVLSGLETALRRERDRGRGRDVGGMDF